MRSWLLVSTYVTVIIIWYKAHSCFARLWLVTIISIMLARAQRLQDCTEKTVVMFHCYLLSQRLLDGGARESMYIQQRWLVWNAANSSLAVHP